jgi:hypothetical protein
MKTMKVETTKTKTFKCYRHQDLKRKNGKLKEREDISVYIYSGQWKAFWRPDGGGYTGDVDQAGVYTLADAWRRTSHCGPEKQIYYLVKEDA